MALRNAVMAALLEGEASGYDLARSFDASVADFWMATPQRLCRELERMAAEGLLQARTVEQEKRPDKRLFSLTASGRRALYAFTSAPPRPGAVREELLVQVPAVDTGDVGAVREAAAERMVWARGKITRYERLRNRLPGGRSEEDHLARAERVGPHLTLRRGPEFEREYPRWGERVLDVLGRRTPSTAGTGAEPD
ncbi:PadR family transcriptional regulator [Streptomonospora arabica]|uniref:PadR family transcriptional regulator n=1 Tax=Streptomonospora arabica TaxID=412417 RepID=A0ABV9SJ11_9ACTN